MLPLSRIAISYRTAENCSSLTHGSHLGLCPMQALAEDLEAVVKENQMVGRQLVSITAERDRWHADMTASAERAQRAETLARCRDSEASQLRMEHEVTRQNAFQNSLTRGTHCHVVHTLHSWPHSLPSGRTQRL